MKSQITCAICEKACEGFGNDAMPVLRGRCCNRCDALIVTPARLAQATGRAPADFFELADSMHTASKRLRLRLRREFKPKQTKRRH